MNPLSAIFATGVAFRNNLYDRGTLKARRLSQPVVSVGNISVGGSGKTPFVIELGKLLAARGMTFDVLSRGHGRRSSKGPLVVDPAGNPERFGDEPILIARALGVPVVVAVDRYQAGLLAEKTFSSQIHLLDDGFQHRRLHRDLDVVLASQSDFTDTLLPVGRLREPPASLRRADALVMVQDEISGSLPEVSFPGLITRAERQIEVPAVSGKTIAFCGLGRPTQFFAMLRRSGLDLSGTVAFPDHHRYTLSDAERLLRLKIQTGANSFITTEKDAINLGTLADRLAPMHLAKLRLLWNHGDEEVAKLLRKLEERRQGRFTAPL